MIRFLKMYVLCAASLAQASGFYLGENGAKAMVQGGAFAAQADDATAMQHNPAGLAQQPGLSIQADLQLLNHDVSFLRQDPGFDPDNPVTVVDKVYSNPPGGPWKPFLLPFFAATYGFPLAGRNFTVGLGLVAPPSQGKYDYPVPNYTKDEAGKYVARPNKYAPQRYAMISNDIKIFYPTLALAYDIHPRFQVGLSAQLAVSHFKQSQTMYGGDAINDNPERQLLENPDYDALVSIDLPGQLTFTGILGLMAKPTDWLTIGASVRPPINFRARGKLTVTLSDFFSKAGAKVNGDDASLTMTMPLELKFGLRATPLPGELRERLGINFDFTYQGWNSVGEIMLTPENVTLVAGPGADPKPVAPMPAKKNWQPAWSARLGASFKLVEFLSVHAGAMYEITASPTTTYSVDWTHPTRIFLTGGLSGRVGPMELIAGAWVTPTEKTIITDSAVNRGQSNPDSEARAVGNGIYTSGAWGLIFGLRGHFEFTSPKPAPTAPDSI